MGPFDSPPMGPISSTLTHIVYLLPFLSYLRGSKSGSARPSDPNDTMTNTVPEAPASLSGKNWIPKYDTIKTNEQELNGSGSRTFVVFDAGVMCGALRPETQTQDVSIIRTVPN